MDEIPDIAWCDEVFHKRINKQDIRAQITNNQTSITNEYPITNDRISKREKIPAGLCSVIGTLSIGDYLELGYW
jgi:hypothetical protein